MRKVLLVLRGPVGPALGERCADAAWRDVELALCYVLPPGDDDLRAGLAAQRALTHVLREARGADAEQIPVFVACSRIGERVRDYATAWGATEVSD